MESVAGIANRDRMLGSHLLLLLVCEVNIATVHRVAQGN